jgi:hypothetical protein
MFYHNIASELRNPQRPNLFSDATLAEPIHDSAPQLIDIYRELVEDYRGVWKGFRVEL